MHDAWNFGIFEMAVRASDVPDRADLEREFADRYQRAVATSGEEYAEMLAYAEALYWIYQINFDASAYLRPLLR